MEVVSKRDKDLPAGKTRRDEGHARNAVRFLVRASNVVFDKIKIEELRANCRKSRPRQLPTCHYREIQAAPAGFRRLAASKVVDR